MKILPIRRQRLSFLSIKQKNPFLEMTKSLVLCSRLLATPASRWVLVKLRKTQIMQRQRKTSPASSAPWWEYIFLVFKISLVLSSSSVCLGSSVSLVRPSFGRNPSLVLYSRYLGRPWFDFLLLLDNYAHCYLHECYRHERPSACWGKLLHDFAITRTWMGCRRWNDVLLWNYYRCCYVYHW